MSLTETVFPVIDARIAWSVVEEEGEWCIQRNKITRHFRLINTPRKLRYKFSLALEPVLEEFRARLSGKTGGPTLLNVPFPTRGGHTFWTVEARDPSGWRIQRNIVTGHYRLLDPKDNRWAWGYDRASLVEALERKREEPPSDVPERNARIARDVGIALVTIGAAVALAPEISVGVIAREAAKRLV